MPSRSAVGAGRPARSPLYIEVGAVARGAATPRNSRVWRGLTLAECSPTLPDPSLTGTAGGAGQSLGLVDKADQKRYYKRLDATAVAADAKLIDK